jgi:hypothetical protein
MIPTYWNINVGAVVRHHSMQMNQLYSFSRIAAAPVLASVIRMNNTIPKKNAEL